MAQYDYNLFITQFPEFSDNSLYPDVLIHAYWDMANVFITADGCPCAILSGSSASLALNYMTAHLLSLGLRAKSADAPGDASGGFLTSATIDKISVASLAPPVKDMWQWWMAQTSYGAALVALLEGLAVGGLTIGGLPERLGFRKVGGVFF
ncbi:hypothetical protein PLUTO_00170 [Luteibacter phage vB_LflM-Pluto]|uniref:Uncharacterized protein n=1 Tax=Luteibacter phage vB_LflM-Pluto TaxID=2948611 RepID=A0A9E7MTP5_9CAUD|nr:hypothetical protein PLUTO_00170 [Luteibacter phage vB_LflM-Pluto]